MSIDNDVYDRLGDGWWDEHNPLNLLHGSFTAGRFEYFRSILARDPDGLRVLDIGCGGGFLAEEFARLGCRVVGIDPSAVSIGTARRHAAGIDYLVAAGERLPLRDSAFDVAYCCDVLEHVTDLESVVAETARVLRPGGLYFFDTINRTLASKLVLIKVAQDWRLTRMIDTTLHVWDMFITPDELTAVLRRHGLRVDELTGLGPRRNKLGLVWDFVQTRRGRLTYGELSRRMDTGRVRGLQVSYMGFAIKA
ncbi:3-demethylubiquinone-9 3-methyltransferase [Kribbella sp. VKM Ac-2527]|uniref:3-demethylubiquinone-9 3-methyltransferase n=1 Tax=Kribbella caucasensis TaxID=2512215 RepID=A0A4R6KPP0_9ACTN|nr:bifunctional 2-polyprenyl-6-hydroxyphenol methylase/3-demethylubiquinol 3-O-methyltransferase UbiG [Kribbella sp. VKM Ac-2527]TDO54646.1 3-demethylubiquinone-9 3-methyltransferase [Kribbella sp. VKM Ac-2527]